MGLLGLSTVIRVNFRSRFFAALSLSEVKIQNARPRACVFAGWGGSISVSRLVRLAQGRPFKVVEPGIPLPEKYRTQVCLILVMCTVRNTLRFKLSSAEIRGQSTTRLSQTGDKADEHVRCDGLSRYISKVLT